MSILGLSRNARRISPHRTGGRKAAGGRISLALSHDREGPRKTMISWCVLAARSTVAMMFSFGLHRDVAQSGHQNVHDREPKFGFRMVENQHATEPEVRQALDQRPAHLGEGLAELG